MSFAHSLELCKQVVVTAAGVQEKNGQICTRCINRVMYLLPFSLWKMLCSLVEGVWTDKPILHMTVGTDGLEYVESLMT